MTRTEKALGIAVLLLGVVVVGLLWMWTGARADTRKTGLQVDSLEAVIDTTRHGALMSARDSVRLLGDSLQLAQRRAVQTRQERDAVDRALGVERIANADLRAEVRRLTTSGTSSSTSNVVNAAGDTSRRASFDLDRPPYRVFAVVTLPAPPAPASMDSLDITLAPIPLSVRPSCGPRNAQGIRQAQWTVQSPAWATVTLTDVQQDPELCNPTGTAARRGWLAKTLGFVADHVGVGPGYSVVLEEGKLHHGPSVNAIVRVWPTR